jgi:hypothetical protein
MLILRIDFLRPAELNSQKLECKDKGKWVLDKLFFKDKHGKPTPTFVAFAHLLFYFLSLFLHHQISSPINQNKKIEDGND